MLVVPKLIRSMSHSVICHDIIRSLKTVCSRLKRDLSSFIVIFLNKYLLTHHRTFLRLFVLSTLVF